MVSEGEVKPKRLKNVLLLSLISVTGLGFVMSMQPDMVINLFTGGNKEITEVFYLAEPHILESKLENKKALQHTIDEIRQIFSEMEDRIPVFVDDLHALNTKIRIIYYLAIDHLSWTENRKRVEHLVLDKFEEDVISAEQLKENISTVISNLEFRLEGNTNQMLSNIKSDFLMNLMGVNHPEISEDFLRINLERACLNEIQRLITLSIGGETVTIILEQYLTPIIMGAITPSIIAVTTETLIGEVGAVTGGVSIGTVTSLVVGIVIAVATDVIITHYSKKHMRVNLRNMISDLEYEIVYGASSDRGLKTVLTKYVSHYSDAQRIGVRKGILKSIHSSGR